MNLDNDKFIVEIEKRPAIWDNRCSKYGNKYEKVKAWEELCSIFIPNFDDFDSIKKNKKSADLQRKWKSLRDCFRRELAKSKKLKNDPGAKLARKEYIYYKKLSYLLPIIDTKAREETESSEITEEADYENIEYVDPLMLSPARVKRKKKSPPVEETLIVQPIPENKKRTVKPRETDDPDRFFLLSLLPHFKKLSEDNKLEVQGEFISILKKYKQSNSQQIHILQNNCYPTVSQFQHFPCTFNVNSSSVESVPTVNNQFSSTNSPPSSSSKVSSLFTQVNIKSESAPPSRASSSLSNKSSVCEDFF